MRLIDTPAKINKTMIVTTNATSVIPVFFLGPMCALPPMFLFDFFIFYSSFFIDYNIKKIDCQCFRELFFYSILLNKLYLFHFSYKLPIY